MNRTPVNSSNLKSVGFDSGSSTLEVEFKDGGVYQYYGVSAKVHTDLMNAASHGTYFDQYVKKAGYKYKKIA